MSDIHVSNHPQTVEVLPAKEIRVHSRTQTIVLDPATQAVSVVNAGPQGPAGMAGTGSDSMNFTQGSALTEWIINHNFGFYPSVSVYSVGGVEMIADVRNITSNQVRIYFNSPTAGSARLS